MKARLLIGIVACHLLSILPAVAAQPLSLPRVFADHMVLQRDFPVPIWGWAEPEVQVTVVFAGQSKSATSGADGKWRVTLDRLPANANGTELAITAGDQTRTIRDVLVGEVWICSGQSNMEWTLAGTEGAQEEIASADHPLLRQFKVPHVTNSKPQKDLPGDWSVCSTATAAQFTAVGYYFALQLHRELGVPIGLLNTSWGGTRIEPWTDPEAFAGSPNLKDVSDYIENADDLHRQEQEAKLNDLEAWIKQCREAIARNSELPPSPGGLPDHPLSRHDKPTAIYNAMVAPLVPYAFRGALWYQGESNNGEGMLYFDKMQALISSWRRLWNQGEFPFLFVQLAPYRYNRPEALPGIWEAQAASLRIPNTGMAVITDIGNVNDIHPRNKKEVGRRLSFWALAKTYGRQDLVYSGPLYKSMRVDGSQVLLSFDHAQGLKSSDGKALAWFTIAGADNNFVPAKAEIIGNNVVVSSAEIPQPAAVRFGWNELAEPNLVNGAGLPASPFRTDRG